MLYLLQLMQLLSGKDVNAIYVQTTNIILLAKKKDTQ